MPILLAMGFTSPTTIAEAQKLTIDVVPRYGITTYMEAGAVLGTRNQDNEWVYQKLIERDQAGELPIRIVGTVWTRTMIPRRSRLCSRTGTSDCARSMCRSASTSYGAMACCSAARL